jgi:alkylation response protein AidB-like acyl-CoA dehydrogenase
VTTTTSTDVLAAARELAPTIRARAEEIEAARHVPLDVARMMAEAGLYRMLQPLAYGGLEIDPLTFYQVIETITAADGAVGWCLMKGATTNYFAAHLPRAGAEEIFGARPDVIVGGSFNPRGQALPVEGGYRISGRWTWGSGIHSSSWMLGGCMIFENGQPRMTPQGPELIAAFFPSSEVDIIDTWHAVGMRGSGSADFAVRDLFVPSDHTFAHLAARPQIAGPLYAIPTPGFIPIGHGPIATGIASAAIEAIVGLAGAKTPLMSRNLLREKEAVQDQVGRAEAIVRAARSFALNALGDVWATVTADAPVTPEQVAALGLSATHATHSCLEAVQLMFTVGAGTSVFESFPVQRHLRDMQTAATHFAVTPDKYAAAGKVLLGV